jgi:hypothetical protein
LSLRPRLERRPQFDFYLTRQHLDVDCHMRCGKRVVGRGDPD